MTRYQTILSLNGDLLKLMGRNIIPIHILDWKVYYEAYLKEANLLLQRHGKPKKTLAAGSVADTYKISERTMFSIIAFMEG